MKAFLKKNWKWLVPVVALVVLLAAVLIPYHFGVRITYNPALMTDWNATAAIASWVGVLVSVAGVAVSGLAIWYAIQVPKKIAARQDKIALFDKRFNCYVEFFKLASFSKALKEHMTNKKVLEIFCSCSDIPDMSNPIAARTWVVQRLNIMQHTLGTGQFVFSKYSGAEAIQMSVAASKLLLSLDLSSEFTLLSDLSCDSEAKRIEFCNKVQEFANKYAASIEADMNLN